MLISIFHHDPTLESYTTNDPDWYKHFHDTFYFAKITNLVFYAYLEDAIKKDIALLSIDDQIKQKIIKKDDSLNDIFIRLDNNKYKSKHIENYIKDYFIPNITNHSTYLDKIFLQFGLKRKNLDNKNVEIDADKLINATYSNNWFEVIYNMLNVYEFLFLYSAVESVFKKILQTSDGIVTSELIDELFKRSKELSKNLVSDYSKVWRFYTSLRNIYAHAQGFINKKTRDDIVGGKRNNLINAITNIYKDKISIEDIESVFQKNLIKEDKFYFINDKELNLFVNIITEFIEKLKNITDFINKKKSNEYTNIKVAKNLIDSLKNIAKEKNISLDKLVSEAIKSQYKI